jgi:hypothetical protein
MWIAVEKPNNGKSGIRETKGYGKLETMVRRRVILGTF